MATRFPRLDVIAASALTVLGVAEASLGITGEVAPWYVVATVPVVTLCVMARRTHPGSALLLMLAAMVAQAAAGSDIGGGFVEPVSLVLVLYAVGASAAMKASISLLAVAAAALTVVVLIGDGSTLGSVVYANTIVLVAWLAGRGVLISSERSQLLAERHLAAERTRLAREIHDVVSHNVSSIVIQAGAQRRELPSGTPASETLRDIESHGRETLQELRRLLGVLHLGDGDREGAPLAPQPGLRDLLDLVTASSRSGIEVSLTSSGEPRPLGEGLELTVYRVVQEALTNARKHGSGGAVSVHLAWQADRIDVEVASTGGSHLPRQLVPGSGFGLRSMTERVTAYGGRVSATPTDEGFRVVAQLPSEGPT